LLYLLIIGCGLLGLAIGSFLNVVIWRVPRGESIVRPPSHCPRCDTPLAELDNIPVISWLVLRGRCRTCSAPISARYPLVELLTAALFAGIAGRFGFSWAVPAYLVFAASLVALSCIDIDLRLLPRVIIYPSTAMVAALLALASGMGLGWHRMLVAVCCSIGWFLLFYLINLASPRYLGFGDVRLSLLLGLALGWLGWGYVLLGFFAGSFVGAVLGLILIWTGTLKRDESLPYGVFLAIGAGIAVFAGPQLLAPFHHLG
jgi:leader peptidase (prepilin peptidase)/N-methyltransferase